MAVAKFKTKRVTIKTEKENNNFHVVGIVIPALRSLRQEDHDQSRLPWEIPGPTTNQTKTML